MPEDLISIRSDSWNRRIRIGLIEQVCAEANSTWRMVAGAISRWILKVH